MVGYYLVAICLVLGLCLLYTPKEDEAPVDDTIKNKEATAISEEVTGEKKAQLVILKYPDTTYVGYFHVERPYFRCEEGILHIEGTQTNTKPSPFELEAMRARLEDLTQQGSNRALGVNAWKKVYKKGESIVLADWTHPNAMYWRRRPPDWDEITLWKVSKKVFGTVESGFYFKIKYQWCFGCSW